MSVAVAPETSDAQETTDVALDRSVAALAKLTPHDGLRPILEGIHLRDHVAVVADGYRLLELELPAAADGVTPLELGDQGVTFAADSLAKAVKQAPRGRAAIANDPRHGQAELKPGEGCGDPWTVEAGQTATALAPIDGAYPEWRTSFPTDDPVVTFAVNPRFLAELLMAMVEVGAEDCVRISVTSPNQAIRLESAEPWDGRKVRGLLMPMVLSEYDR